MAQSRHKSWHGARTRRTLAAPSPDAPPRLVELPVGWDDTAAEALAALAPGQGPARLTDAAEAWLARLPDPLAATARLALQRRRAAPDEAIWAGRRDGFALNLAAFEEPGLGPDLAGLRETAEACVACLRILAPGSQPVLRLTDLDGMLAASGLDYASQEARDAAVSVASSLSGLGARLMGQPGLVDALLGAEAGGIAPRFDWLDAAGRLSRGAMAFLAARGVSAEAALAASLSGRSLLPHADATANAAMRAALAPLMALPALPLVARPPAPRRAVPARPGGYAGRVALGGHRLFVRTAEFADGTLAEVSLGLPKESAPVRALADSLGQVISLALQHGAPVSDLIDLLVGTRFGPAGTVDGDPDVAAASSPLDYLARSLAAAYAPDQALPPAEIDSPMPALPLEMPPASRPKLLVVR